MRPPFPSRLGPSLALGSSKHPSQHLVECDGGPLSRNPLVARSVGIVADAYHEVRIVLRNRFKKVQRGRPLVDAPPTDTDAPSAMLAQALPSTKSRLGCKRCRAIRTPRRHASRRPRFCTSVGPHDERRNRRKVRDRQVDQETRKPNQPSPFSMTTSTNISRKKANAPTRMRP